MPEWSGGELLSLGAHIPSGDGLAPTVGSTPSGVPATGDVRGCNRTCALEMGPSFLKPIGKKIIGYLPTQSGLYIGTGLNRRIWGGALKNFLKFKFS